MFRKGLIELTRKHVVKEIFIVTGHFPLEMKEFGMFAEDSCPFLLLRLAKLESKNRIRFVEINLVINSGKCILELVKAGASVHIGENYSKNKFLAVHKYFQHSRKSWDAMRKDLELEGVS